MLTMVTTGTLITMVTISGSYASHENKTAAIPSKVITGTLVTTVTMLPMVRDSSHANHGNHKNTRSHGNQKW